MFYDITLWFYITRILLVMFVTTAVLCGLMSIAYWMWFASMCDDYRHYGEEEEYIVKTKKKQKDAIRLSVIMLISIVLAVAVPSREFIIAFRIAPQVDKYIEENPDTLFSVDGVIGKTEDIVLSIFSTIEGIPNLIDATSDRIRNGGSNETTKPVSPTN